MSSWLKLRCIGGAVIIAVLLTFSESQVANIIPNGDFELAFKGWVTDANAPLQYPRFQLDAFHAFSGRYSLKLSAVTVTCDVAIMDEQPRGIWYQFVAWVSDFKLPNVRAQISIIGKPIAKREKIESTDAHEDEHSITFALKPINAPARSATSIRAMPDQFATAPWYPIRAIFWMPAWAHRCRIVFKSEQ
ncbi:MAG TPA: hypothetical protein EYP10_13885, partial [Armatimonadetes bacterium]|nr:hypothetical protein [Armatimonadota bacterium]